MELAAHPYFCCREDTTAGNWPTSWIRREQSARRDPRANLIYLIGNHTASNEPSRRAIHRYAYGRRSPHQRVWLGVYGCRLNNGLYLRDTTYDAWRDYDRGSLHTIVSIWPHIATVSGSPGPSSVPLTLSTPGLSTIFHPTLRRILTKFFNEATPSAPLGLCNHHSCSARAH